MFCYYETPGCLAVNVITTGDVITCEMTTGLSNEADMVDDSTSVLYVAGKLLSDPGSLNCWEGGCWWLRHLGHGALGSYVKGLTIS